MPDVASRFMSVARLKPRISALLHRRRDLLEKTNEITAIPDLLDHQAETNQPEGALVTIDALASVGQGRRVPRDR